MARGSGGNSGGNSSGSSSGGADFSPEFHIELAPGSIVFAVFYGLTLLYYLRRASDNTTYVFIMLSFFCAIRVTTFALTAVIEGSDSATVGVYVAAEALYGAGFFALLDSAYTLVLDRNIVIGNVAKNPISRVASNRCVVRIVLAVAVAFGIAEAVSYYQRNGNIVIFMVVSVVTFLAVTAILGVKAVIQAYEEHAALSKRGTSDGESSGTTYVTYIPCLIVILLLARGIYITVRTNAITSQSQVIWYLFAAAPELLAVFCFAVPGLVPQKGCPIPHAHGDEDPEMTKSV